MATTTDPPTSAQDPEPAPASDRRAIQAARRQEAKKKRRRWPRRLLIGTIVFILLVVLAGVGLYLYAQYRFHQIKKIHAKHLVVQAPPGQPFNVLLVGSDSRAFVQNSVQINAFGDPGTQGGQRSDVTIIARFVPASHQIWLLSIPRDLWVDIPGNVAGVSGQNRINTAFDSGPDLLIQTIEQDLHIPINHYVAVNFDGFQNMVGALGGVQMNFPMPVKDDYSGLNVTQTGCQSVDGATALELVRARHLYYEQDGTWQYDGLSDFSRIQRQDAFFRAVLAKVNAEVFNPFTMNAFIGAAVHDVTIDDQLSETQLFDLARQLHGMPAADLHTETLPTYGFTTDGGAEVLGTAEPYADQTIAAFNQLGQPPPPTTTTTTTTAPAIPPAQISIRVENGADWSQPLASGAASGFQAVGFQVSGAENAPSQGAAATVVSYAPGGQAAAQEVASHLSGTTQLVADSSLQGQSVVVVLGTSFTGVTGVPASATTTTTNPGPPSGDVITNSQPEPWNPVPC